MEYDLKPLQRTIDDQGMRFLDSRYLDAETALKMRISAYGGNVYFPFVLNGEILGYKVRNMQDKKEQRSIDIALSKDPKKKTWPFFNQIQPQDNEYLIITEGEFDCMALVQLGAENVVSLPHGASSVEKTFKDNYKFLQEFKTIYIAFDMDEPGQKAADKASKLIAPNKYRRLNFPEGMKDANEWLIQAMPKGDDLARLMIDSKRIFTPEIVPMYELNEEITKAIDLGESTGYKTLDNILGGLRLGELLVITADTGSGKSTFCTNLIVHLAKNNNPIWVNSYEMDYRVIGRKIASVALKKNLRYKEFTDQEDMELAAWTLKHPVFINPISRGQSVKELRNTIEMAAFAYGIKYIFIDHLDYIKARGERDSVLENIDEAMRELHQIALEFRVSIILVVHPVQIKEKRELTIHDLKGSSSIKQYADNIIILTRLDNLNPNDKGFVKIDVVKNRLFGKQQFFKMKYNYETDTYSEADCGIY